MDEGEKKRKLYPMDNNQKKREELLTQIPDFELLPAPANVNMQ